MASKQIIFCSLLVAETALAQSRWIRDRSENFEIYSDAGEAGTRDALRSLEQVRSFLIQSTGAGMARQERTYLVGFKSEAEYAPYRTSEAGSFYLTGTDRDVVVTGGMRPEELQAAIGSYAQLAFRQMGLSLPGWLDQGLSDLCSTFKQTGTVGIIGEIPVDQRRALAAEPQVPLEAILSGSHKSRLQAETFVHMLVLSPDYGPRFKELVAALESSLTPQAALEQVYAKPLSGIEKDLRAYVSGGHNSATSLPLKPGSTLIQAAEPVASFDLNLVLADVYNRPGQEKEAQDRLDSLARGLSTRPEPWAGLGYVALRRGQLDLAAQYFERALALGAHSVELMWDNARLGWRDSAADSEEALGQLLQREPNRVDARLKLAAIQLDHRRPRQAYALLQPVKEIPADVAPRFLLELAYAGLETGERSEAQVTLSRLAKAVSSPRDSAELNRLQNYAAGAQVTPAASALAAAILPDNPSKASNPSSNKALDRTPEKTPEKAPAAAHVTLGSTPTGSSAGAADRRKATETFENAAAAAREKSAAEAQALAEAESLARQAAEAREKANAAVRERAAAEAQEKAAAKAREKAESEANAKDAAEAREKAAAEAREKAAAEVREKAAAKAREKAESEANAKDAAEAREKAAAEAREKAATEVREKAAAKAREKAESVAQAMEAAAAKERAIAEARDKAAAEAREKAEALARGSAEAEAQALAQAQAQAKAKTDADAREKALAETRAKVTANSALAGPQLASNIVPAKISPNAAPPNDVPSGSAPVGPAAPSDDDSSIASGVFAEMVCMETQIKIVLQTPQGKKNYLIEDPSNVVVSGREGGKVELECGAQKPVNLRILFGRPGSLAFDGLVKGLYFE